MKTNAVIRIVVFSLAILILFGILLSVLFLDIYSFSRKTEVAHYEQVEGVSDLHTIDAEVQNIEIDWVAGSITIRPDPSVSNIQIAEYCGSDSEYRMVIRQSGQTLKIQYCEETFDFPSIGGNIDISKDLVITVPADWYCNCLEIDTASAELTIEGLTIQEFDFDGASGICNIVNCDITQMDLDTASGNVNFSGTLDTLECDAASASCRIEVLNIPRFIKMNAMSGDLELVLPPEAGFTCKLSSMSGDFDSDFEFQSKNDTYTHGDGACQIKVSAMSGDVTILKGIE